MHCTTGNHRYASYLLETRDFAKERRFVKKVPTEGRARWKATRPLSIFEVDVAQLGDINPTIPEFTKI